MGRRKEAAATNRKREEEIVRKEGETASCPPAEESEDKARKVKVADLLHPHLHGERLRAEEDKGGHTAARREDSKCVLKSRNPKLRVAAPRLNRRRQGTSRAVLLL